MNLFKRLAAAMVSVAITATMCYSVSAAGADEKTATSIEIIKAPDKTVYYAETLPIPDLTGMAINVHYADGTTETLNDEQMKALVGYETEEQLNAYVEDETESLVVSYLYCQASTPVTILDEVIAEELIVMAEPTGVGLQGLELEAVEPNGEFFSIIVYPDQEPVFSMDSDGMTIDCYDVGTPYGNFMLTGAYIVDELTGETCTVVSVMNLFAIIGDFDIDIDLPEITLTEDSSYYLDTEYLYACGISAETTVAEFKTNFVEDIELSDIEGVLLDDDAFVGTGAWINVLVSDEEFGDYYVNSLYETVIAGDVSGDGQVNSTDFMQIRRNYLGLHELYGASLLAADVSADGQVNSTDFMQVRRHFLGLYDLYA